MADEFLMDPSAGCDDASKQDLSPCTAADRARTRWGMERILMLHGLSEDDGDLARTLQRHLRHMPVVMLHDRLLPDGALVEHLAVGPGGITIIGDLCDFPRPLQVKALQGIFGARAELLLDNAGTDRSAMLTPVRERIVAVREVIADVAPVEGALCVTADDSSSIPLRPIQVRGVLIAGPKAIAELAARPGDVDDTQLATLVDHLHASLPPALHV